MLVALGSAAGGCRDDGNGTDADAVSQDAADSGDEGTSRSVVIEGLSGPTKVQFDQAGVLHVDCQTNLDCYAAQGYFHADARFFLMEMTRREARGQLSQIIGKNFGFESDKVYRHMMTTREGKPLEEAYLEQVNPKTEAMLKAYARGVNSWLEDLRNGQNGATLTEEYEFPLLDKKDIRDWEPEDTIASYLRLADQLTYALEDDLFRGEMMGQLGLDRGGDSLKAQVASDLFTVRPGIESNVIGASGATVPTSFDNSDRAAATAPAALEDISERLTPAVDALHDARRKLQSRKSIAFGQKTGEGGSNNWVLAGTRTKSGQPLLANDPHLKLYNPAIWHFAELDSKTNGDGNLHVAGASLPSLPGIVIGHNEQIAWGVTVAMLDLADTYVESLNEEATAVIRDGREIELIERDYTFDLKGGSTETVTFEWVPNHGPLLSKDPENNRGISIKWVAHHPGNDINFLPDLMTAESVDDAMAALEPVRAINQNWVFMDREDDGDSAEIGWYPKGAIPKRPWVDADTPNWMPLPGDGSAEWNGHLSAENSPKLRDPPKAFIATANNDFDGSYTDGDATNDGHTPWQDKPLSGHRHRRIVEMIKKQGDAHSRKTMREIQSDTLSLHARRLVPKLLEIAEANDDQLSAATQTVIEALKNWNYTCPTGLDGHELDEASKAEDATEARESIGCSAFHVLVPILTEAVFEDELQTIEDYSARQNWEELQDALLLVFTDPSQLARETAYFDDVTTKETEETQSDIVIDTLGSTASALANAFDSSAADDWRWGKIHTVTFFSPFSEDGVDTYDNGPYANDGGFWTVDKANPVGTDNQFHHKTGASMRVVFQGQPDGIRGWFQLPGGQDNHRDSKWYGSLIDEWLTHTPTELLFDRAEVEQEAVKTITVEPPAP